MDEINFEKKLKGTKMFCILIGIIFIFSMIIHIILKNTLYAIISFAVVILMYLFYNCTKKRKIIGPIIGILLGGCYIVSFIWTRGIISVIIGIVVLIDSISMFKFIKNN